MSDHTEPSCADCKHPIGTLAHVLACGNEARAMNIREVDSREFEERRRSNACLFADVREVRVNQSIQLIIKIRGQYKGKDVDRTFMYPCPSFPGKTINEAQNLRIQVLTGYLDAIQEILDSEHKGGA